MATENADPNPTPKPAVYLQDMEEVKRVFNRFDANGDGKISVTELVNVMKALGSNTYEEEVSRMMDGIDADRDGFINLHEFADFCKGDCSFVGGGEVGDDGGLRELREAFELYDQDRNGLISDAEIHQILTRLGENCSVKDCARMIKSVDSDGDGFVNFEEFKKMMTKTAATTNGVIDS